MNPHHARRAFSLIELIVSIGIIALLIAISIPILGSVKAAAQRTKCQSNARQILVAINAFSATNQSRLPENRTQLDDSTYITWRQLFDNQGFITEQEVWTCPRHKNPGPGSEQGYSSGGLTCVGDITASYALNGHVLWRRAIDDADAIRPDTAIQRPSHTILLPETNLSFSDLRASPPFVANYYGAQPGPYSYWHEARGTYGFQDGHVELITFLNTGSPDCRWHNGKDLTSDPFVPQTAQEIQSHSHEDWEFLVPKIYLESN